MGSRSYIFNILHKDLHKKLHKEPLLPMSLILFAVILAYSFRLIGRGSFYPTLFSYLRSFIYIGLYAAWGISIRQRIVQKQVGQYLVGVSVLFDFVVYLSLSKILYILATGCNKIPVVSILSANAVCTHACTADRNVSGQAR